MLTDLALLQAEGEVKARLQGAAARSGGKRGRNVRQGKGATDARTQGTG